MASREPRIPAVIVRAMVASCIGGSDFSLSSGTFPGQGPLVPGGDRPAPCTFGGQADRVPGTARGPGPPAPRRGPACPAGGRERPTRRTGGRRACGTAGRRPARHCRGPRGSRPVRRSPRGVGPAGHQHVPDPQALAQPVETGGEVEGGGEFTAGRLPVRRGVEGLDAVRIGPRQGNKRLACAARRWAIKAVTCADDVSAPAMSNCTRGRLPQPPPRRPDGRRPRRRRPPGG